ncbi:MAG: toll/interleukin-1 receptor domain-containing protein [Elainellaceae cyanobacterium]
MVSNAITVFFSYSHKDERLRDELANHLRILERKGVIADWHDRQILPGDEWDREINDNLSSAQIILLLVSSDFLASSYCWDVEITRAMERHEAGEACVIPIILRSCLWSSAPFGKLQALPKNAVPVTKTETWSTLDDAFTDIARGIQKAANDILQKLTARKENNARKENSSQFQESNQTDATHVQSAQRASHPETNPIGKLNASPEESEESIDIAALATLLSPFLPGLMNLEEQATDKTSAAMPESFDKAVLTKAQKIWRQLSPQVKAREDLKIAATQVAAKPESAARQAMFQEELEALLKENLELWQAIAHIMQEGMSDLPSSTQIIQNVTGKENQVIGQVLGGKVVSHVEGNVTM